MSTQIGSLVIEMSANIARLQSDMNMAKSVVNDSMKSITDAVDLAKKAMVAFAGVATLDAFVGMVRGNIEAAAAMGRLATVAGVTTEALSGLAAAGKLSGTGADTIAAAMNKMTKAVSGTTEDAKGAGAALNALGISFSDFDKMSADQRMLAVAKAMDQFQDGTGKSAVAMALMGKAGAEMLPYLKDLATLGELHAKVTSEQAAQAKDFEQNLKRVKATSEAWKKELSMGMLPALDEASKAYLGLMNSTGGFRDEISKLSKDGSIAEWTRTLIVSLTYLVDVLEGAWRVAKAVGVGLGAQWAAMAQAAQGNLGNAASIIKDAWSDIGDIFSAQTMGSKFRDRMEELKGVKLAVEAVKPALDGTFNRKADAADGVDKANPQIKAYADLIARIKEKIAADNLEAESGKKLTEAQQAALDIEKLVATGKLKSTDASSTATKALLAELDVAEKNKILKLATAAADLAAAEAHTKYVASLIQGLEKLQQEVATQQELNDRMGLSKEAIAALDAAKLESKAIALDLLAVKTLDKDMDEYQYALYKKQAQALRDLAAAQQQGAGKAAAIENFKAIWDSVDKTAHDVFVNIFQGGQDAFTKLRDVLKATLLDLLYQMTVKKWIFDITASVSGASGGVGGAALQAVSGGAGGGLGGLGALGGAFGSAFSSGFGATMSSFGSTIGLSIEGGLASIGVGTSGAIFSGLGQIAGALGPIGIGIAGLSALSSAMQYKITPTGSGLTATLGAGGVKDGHVGAFSQFEQKGGLFGGGTTTNRDWSTADTGTTQYIDQTSKALSAASKAMADSLGLDTSSMSTFSKAIEINTAGMDEAAAKKAIDTALIKFNSDMISGTVGPAFADLAKTGETSTTTLQRLAISLTTVNSVFGLLGTSLVDISVKGAASASKIIDAFGGLEKFTSKMGSFYANFYSPEEKRQDTLHGVGNSLRGSGLGISDESLGGLSRDDYRKLAESIKASLGADSPAYVALINAGDAFASITPSVREATKSIMDLVAGIHKSVGDAIFGMQYGLEDNHGKYNMLDVKGKGIDDKMHDTNDINLIAKYGNEEIDVLKQAWSLLTVDQQRASELDFEKRFKAIDDYVTGKGADAISIAQSKDEKTGKIIGDIVGAAVAKAIKDSGATLTKEKDPQQPQAPLKVDITVTKPASTEVAVDVSGGGYRRGDY